MSVSKVTNMKVAYLREGFITCRDDYPLPSLEAEQVLVKVSLAGICATDIALFKGYVNFAGVPGHEFVGEVVDVGKSADTAWLKKRVAVEINQYCGTCFMCLSRQGNHCAHRRVIGIRNHQGAFAQFIAVNQKTLHVLPNGLDDKRAVFIEPLAAAYRVLDQLDSLAGQRVLLIGAGKLGQLIARVVKTQRCELSVVTRNNQQRCLLANTADVCLSENAVEARAWDVLIEASGQLSGLELALVAVKPGGRVVLKSTYLEDPQIKLSELVINETRLIGSRCGPFEKAIEALLTGRINPLPLVEEEYSLNEIEKAMSHASLSGTMKVLVHP